MSLLTLAKTMAIAAVQLLSFSLLRQLLADFLEHFRRMVLCDDLHAATVEDGRDNHSSNEETNAANLEDAVRNRHPKSKEPKENKEQEHGENPESPHHIRRAAKGIQTLKHAQPFVALRAFLNALNFTMENI